GQLGLSSPFGESGRKFGLGAGVDLIRECAQGLQIQSPDRAAGGAVDSANELLAEADRICFLGFGYDPINCERLRPGLAGGGSKTIFGTAYGLEGAETERARAAVGF